MSEPRTDSAAWLECLQAAAAVCAAEVGYMGAREMGGSPCSDPRESLAAGYVAAKADEFYALLQRRAPSAPPAEPRDPVLVVQMPADFSRDALDRLSLTAKRAGVQFVLLPPGALLAHAIGGSVTVQTVPGAADLRDARLAGALAAAERTGIAPGSVGVCTMSDCASVPPAELSTADALEDPPSVELGAAAVAGATEPAGPPEPDEGPIQIARDHRARLAGCASCEYCKARKGTGCAQSPCPCTCHHEEAIGPPVPEARIGWWAGTHQRAHAAILGEPLAHYLCGMEVHKRDERFTARRPTHEERCSRCALRVELTPSPRITRDRVDWVADTVGSFHAYDTNGLPRPAPCGAVRRATGHAEKSPPVKHCCVRCLLNIDYPEGRIADGKA